MSNLGKKISIGPRVVFLVWLSVLLLTFDICGFAQKRSSTKAQTNKSHSLAPLSAEERETIKEAISVVCTERKKDPKGSVPIDVMQARPSLPVRSEEAQAGAERAKNLLPVAKELVIESLRKLANDYGFKRNYNARLQQALSRVAGVTTIKPDMDARDNASVLLSRPRTITFGTLFLDGLPSEEGMISVLAHELTHLADGNNEALTVLFAAIGERASDLTGEEIRDQRAEELACDLVGAMASRLYVARSPNYEPLPRRLARSIEHNCVDQDEGDDDHLSPRATIGALLALNHSLTRELISGREEPLRPRPSR